MDGDKARLVERVKAWQKMGDTHKETWWKYCREMGLAKYDPNLQDAMTLNDFLSQADAGTLELVQPRDFQGSGSKGGKKGKGSSWSSGSGWGSSGGGWGGQSAGTGPFDPEIEAKLDQWVQLKRDKDFGAADALREEIRAAGVNPNEARPDPRRPGHDVGQGGWGGGNSWSGGGGSGNNDPEIEAKLDRWVELKRSKDFGAADALREEIRAAGVNPNEARPDPRRPGHDVGQGGGWGGGKGGGGGGGNDWSGGGGGGGDMDPMAMMGMMMGMMGMVMNGKGGGKGGKGGKGNGFAPY